MLQILRTHVAIKKPYNNYLLDSRTGGEHDFLSWSLVIESFVYLSFIENKYIHIKQEQTTWLANLADWENKNQKQNECAVVNASSCLNIVTETCPWQRLLTPPPSSWENIIES